MCAPDFYGIEYEINPWMNCQRQSDHALAMRQWREFRQTLESLGVAISLLEPVKGLPDLVFTANAAMVYGRRAVLSRFRHPQRRGEEEYDERWLSGSGFEVLRLPERTYFEGAGDALFCGDTLFAGYRKRSDARAHQQVGKSIGCQVIPLELVDAHYYHLDTCFCPIAPGVAIYYPGAFDEYGRRVLGELVGEMIEVDGDEAPSAAVGIRQGGRQCQMPDAAAGRRGSRGLEVCCAIGGQRQNTVAGALRVPFAMQAGRCEAGQCESRRDSHQVGRAYLAVHCSNTILTA
jgi:N-dimethylarginine dimethylaminohydrolase